LKKIKTFEINVGKGVEVSVIWSENGVEMMGAKVEEGVAMEALEREGEG